MMFTVTVTMPGHGRYQGGSYVTSRTFLDEAKARDYYTDMLLRCPKYEVELTKENTNV